MASQQTALMETYVHQARINVQIGVNLDRRNSQTSSLQQQTTTRGNDALPHTGDDSCKKSEMCEPQANLQIRQWNALPPETRTYFILASGQKTSVRRKCTGGFGQRKGWERAKSEGRRKKQKKCDYLRKSCGRCADSLASNAPKDLEFASLYWK